jgi:S1-C subfamily serine protease
MRNERTIQLPGRGVQTVRREVLGSTVVPVLVRADGVLSGRGSAFALGSLQPGYVLYATARHVVEEPEKARASEIFVVVPLNPDADSELVTARAIEAVVMEHTSDAALLLVDLDTAPQRPEWEPRGLALTLATPTVGALSCAFGYARHSVGRHSGRDAFSSALLAAAGSIEEIHLQCRDRVMVDYPSFRTGVQYEQGMSGGPIFAESGYVIGIVTVGSDISGSPYGYGAHAATLTELPLPRACGRPGTTFGELLERGELRSEPSSVTLTRTEEGLELSWPDA